ncbi:hypothetical protein BGZ75_010055 [Mortierella antarctica]|nr:hypothetical protein BGZ75_010055 [Mortierella antarctica]
MDEKLPYDEWNRHIHAVITFLKPFFDDWRSYVSLASMLLGIGVLIMENQVLLRMRMGRWEVAGYVIWCFISSVLGPVFDIVVMVGLFIYCRRKSNRLHITHESIAKALLPAPVAKNYQVMGGVCVAATLLTLLSNVLYMLRGWKESWHYFDRSLDVVRWLTSQIWYAIGMIFLFHVVTRPAQSGVVIFGKFPRDLWAYKWYLCILYIPVHYMLLELCDVHRDTKAILIPLEILVDVALYNGPFLVFLLRILHLAWKVAYDEAVLTGAIFDEDNSAGVSPVDGGFPGTSRRAPSSHRPGAGSYVGLAMVDLDEAERGHAIGALGQDRGSESPTKAKAADAEDPHDQHVYVLEDEEDDVRASAAVSRSPSRSPLKRNVMFDVDMTEEEGGQSDEENGQGSRRQVGEDERLV